MWFDFSHDVTCQDRKMLFLAKVIAFSNRENTYNYELQSWFPEKKGDECLKATNGGIFIPIFFQW